MYNQQGYWIYNYFTNFSKEEIERKQQLLENPNTTKNETKA